MKPHFGLLMVAMLLSACSGAPGSGGGAPTRATTPPPSLTSTPTPMGTWAMVLDGTVFDQSTGRPITGATVRYVVVQSFFPELQDGRTNVATSDARGGFQLPVLAHDTDTVSIVVEADHFAPYEERLDLFGRRSLSLGLTPLATEAAGPL